MNLLDHEPTLEEDLDAEQRLNNSKDSGPDVLAEVSVC